MVTSNCVRCGSVSELLLNLVCCTSPRCQNFDLLFFKKWVKKANKFHTNSLINPAHWTFLGTYTKYDLYTNGAETYAVFGPGTESIFVGSNKGQPYGIYMAFWYGPEAVNASGRKALLEAAARRNI